MTSRHLSLFATVASIACALTACGDDAVIARSRVQLDPRDVQGMPVLWLGDAYDGDKDGEAEMPLTSAELNDSPEFRDPRNGQLVKPETRWYSMGYGSCTPPTPRPGDEQFGCPIPLQLDFYSLCDAPPLDTTGMPRVSLRGVQAFEEAPGSLWIETADFTVSVHVALRESFDEQRAHAKQIVDDLIPANAEAAAFTKGSSFAPRTAAIVQQKCGVPGARITSSAGG